jgi:hypothetical protein
VYGELRYGYFRTTALMSLKHQRALLSPAVTTDAAETLFEENHREILDQVVFRIFQLRRWDQFHRDQRTARLGGASRS